MTATESPAPRPLAVLLALPVLAFAAIAAPLAPGLRVAGLLLIAIVAGATIVQRPVGRRLADFGLLCAAAWGVFFAAGAAGELLDIEWLRAATDYKKIFLR